LSKKFISISRLSPFNSRDTSNRRNGAAIGTPATAKTGHQKPAKIGLPATLETLATSKTTAKALTPEKVATPEKIVMLARAGTPAKAGTPEKKRRLQEQGRQH
jgi:hypothetical protein